MMSMLSPFCLYSRMQALYLDVRMNSRSLLSPLSNENSKGSRVIKHHIGFQFNEVGSPHQAAAVVTSPRQPDDKWHSWPVYEPTTHLTAEALIFPYTGCKMITNIGNGIEFFGKTFKLLTWKHKKRNKEIDTKNTNIVNYIFSMYFCRKIV